MTRPQQDSGPADGVLVLGASDIRRLLPMRDCIDLLRAAMVAALHPDSRLPLRTFTALPGSKAGLGVMPGVLPDGQGFGAKVITVFPDNFEHGLPSHQGVVLLFDPERGRLLAILDAGEITAIRTAAASGLATDLLARKGPSVLALLGYGEQAAAHLESMAVVRPLTEVRVWGRSLERAAKFVGRHADLAGAPIRAVATLEAALGGADIVCATTASTEPFLPGARLEQGMHVNLVGSSKATEREADDEVVARSRFYVDFKPSTLAQAGEFLSALKSGVVTEDHIVGQLGEVVAGLVPGRSSPHDITVYKSLGIAAQDLACATHLVARAQAADAGVTVSLRGNS